MAKKNSPSETTVPPQAAFRLVLKKLIKGTAPVIKNAGCDFDYNWNFQSNTGIAYLVAINNSAVNITLYPIGVESNLDFMADMAPTPFNINGQTVIIDKVVLRVNLLTNNRTAAIVFNADESVIQANTGFQVKSIAL